MELANQLLQLPNYTEMTFVSLLKQYPDHEDLLTRLISLSKSLPSMKDNDHDCQLGELWIISVT